tara:strand:- start:273 stop:470 length:198 start_codon:yes stop_codon:yes gene_type:complete
VVALAPLSPPLLALIFFKEKKIVDRTISRQRKNERERKGGRGERREERGERRETGERQDSKKEVN